MSLSELAQRVVEFEYSRIRTPYSHAHPLPNLEPCQSQRFQEWGLAGTLQQLKLREEQCRVYWCGYGNQCYIEAFVYCLLTGWKRSRHLHNHAHFTQMKYSLYQLAQEHLD